MRAVSDQEILQLWEQGIGKSKIEKSLRLVMHVFPELDLETAASLSIGDRDARLLQIRKQLYGSVLQNTTQCPQCGEKVEWEMPMTILELQPVQAAIATRKIPCQVEEEEWLLRLPNTLDVLEIMDLPDMTAQTNILLHRCLIRPGLPLEKIEAYPQELKTSILEQMEAQDPQANIELEIACAACSNTWAMVFDIISYLWAEIDQMVQQLVREVFILAKHFGWSEKDILQMSRTRRNWYLQMLAT